MHFQFLFQVRYPEPSEETVYILRKLFLNLVATRKNACKRPGPLPFALAEIASPPTSFAQFASNQLHLLQLVFTVTGMVVCMHFHGSPPNFGTVATKCKQFPFLPISLFWHVKHEVMRG